MPQIQQTVSLNMELSVEDALWLKGKMQNPTGPENSKDHGMRLAFFNALPNFKVLEAIEELGE